VCVIAGEIVSTQELAAAIYGEAGKWKALKVRMGWDEAHSWRGGIVGEGANFPKPQPNFNRVLLAVERTGKRTKKPGLPAKPEPTNLLSAGQPCTARYK
jgi:hypothetical protein